MQKPKPLKILLFVSFEVYPCIKNFVRYLKMEYLGLLSLEKRKFKVDFMSVYKHLTGGR